MANDKYSDAVAVTLRPSPTAAGFAVAAAGATLVLLALTPLAAAARILLATAVLCAALGAWGRARTARRLTLDRDGAIVVERATGRVRAGCFVAPWLTIVRWRPDGGRFDRTVLVLPDMLPAAEFRRLRVLLRWP